MSRRAPRRASALVVAAAVFGLAARADAKASIQGTATVAAGWTDNVLNAPSPPFRAGTPPPCDVEKATAAAPCPANSPPIRYSDFMFELRPGAVLVTGAARAVQRLAYNFSADLFVE